MSEKIFNIEYKKVLYMLVTAVWFYAVIGWFIGYSSMLSYYSLLFLLNIALLIFIYLQMRGDVLYMIFMPGCEEFIINQGFVYKSVRYDEIKKIEIIHKLNQHIIVYYEDKFFRIGNQKLIKFLDALHTYNKQAQFYAFNFPEELNLYYSTKSIGFQSALSHFEQENPDDVPAFEKRKLKNRKCACEKKDDNLQC